MDSFKPKCHQRDVRFNSYDVRTSPCCVAEKSFSPCFLVIVSPCSFSVQREDREVEKTELLLIDRHLPRPREVLKESAGAELGIVIKHPKSHQILFPSRTLLSFKLSELQSGFMFTLTSQPVCSSTIIVIICGHPEFYESTSYLYKDQDQIAWRKVSKEVAENICLLLDSTCKHSPHRSEVGSENKRLKK